MFSFGRVGKGLGVKFRWLGTRYGLIIVNRDASGNRVERRGGFGNADGVAFVDVSGVQGERRKSHFGRQDVGVRGFEAVCNPSDDHVPDDLHTRQGFVIGREGVIPDVIDGYFSI